MTGSLKDQTVLVVGSGGGLVTLRIDVAGH